MAESEKQSDEVEEALQAYNQIVEQISVKVKYLQSI
jgi:hypothetical protein